MQRACQPTVFPFPRRRAEDRCYLRTGCSLRRVTAETNSLLIGTGAGRRQPSRATDHLRSIAPACKPLRLPYPWVLLHTVAWVTTHSKPWTWKLRRTPVWPLNEKPHFSHVVVHCRQFRDCFFTAYPCCNGRERIPIINDLGASCIDLTQP